MYQYAEKTKALQKKTGASDWEKQTVNRTGIPAQMKQRFEKGSGFALDDVQVHYNSEKPLQMQALAYTQGSQVYLGPGQEQYLGHELGHVIQQKQGIVTPTGSIGGEPMNDEAGLEQAADRMAADFH